MGYWIEEPDPLDDNLKTWERHLTKLQKLPQDLPEVKSAMQYAQQKIRQKQHEATIKTPST